MPRLNWSAVGERFYETGVDRGVLFVDGQYGVAWPGLISVSEAPSGGEPKPYYIDGIKYLNLSSAEEYEATINAFYYPDEFAPCHGAKAISNGLFVTQQPRKQFGFSYRTRLGNDLDATDHAYKIHLVYNALAASSEHTVTTINDSAEPALYNFIVSTVPPRVPGYKPTAHFVINSRLTPVSLLGDIEDILYGSDAAVSRMPTAQELVNMFSAA